MCRCSLLDSIPNTRSLDMTDLAHTVFAITPCVDWMAVYAQNEQLQVYTRNDTKTEFCFLRVPDCANRHVQSLNLLDVHASHAVVTLSNKFCFIFSTALARLIPSPEPGRVYKCLRTTPRFVQTPMTPTRKSDTALYV